MKITLSRSNLVIVLLSVLSFLFSASPVWKNKGPGVFFEADPDFVYLSNSIFYVQTNQISYHDHPGTPAIRILSTSYLPLRVYAKIIAKEPFVLWFVRNPDSVYLYARTLQSVLLAAGIFIILKGVQRLTGSYQASTLLWVSLYTFVSLPYTGSSISAESTNLFLLSLVISIYSFFYRSRSSLILLPLSFFCGDSTFKQTDKSFYRLGCT